MQSAMKRMALSEESKFADTVPTPLLTDKIFCAGGSKPRLQRQNPPAQVFGKGRKLAEADYVDVATVSTTRCPVFVSQSGLAWSESLEFKMFEQKE